jgi:hypothetical protein
VIRLLLVSTKLLAIAPKKEPASPYAKELAAAPNADLQNILIKK